MTQMYPKMRLGKLLAGLALAGVLSAPAAKAQTHYFANQVFSTSTGDGSTGTFNGGTFSISYPAGVTTALFTSAPASGFPTGNDYPASGPMSTTLASSGASRTITITFSKPLTPADHIYLEDVDNSETASFSFRDALNNVIDPSSFKVAPISTSYGYSISKNATRILLTANSSLFSEPLVEIIPATVVNSIQLTLSSAGGNFAIFFGRNRPLLVQSLSASQIPVGGTARLTYNLTGLNYNPIYDQTIVNTLPTGWVVANNPSSLASIGSITAAPGASTVTLSSITTDGTAMTMGTYWVDITNAGAYTNGTCSSNPAASTNGSANFTTDPQAIQNTITPVCLVVGTPLPIKLLSFEGKGDQCGALLTWQSASEEGCRYYGIERSSGGGQWESVERVAAAGDKDRLHSYSYTDRDAAGNHYYRLKMVGEDGTVTYSATVAVRNECGAGNSIRLFPNPAGSLVSVELSQYQDRTIRVYNSTGTLVHAGKAAAATTTLSSATWQPGLYQVVVMDGSGKVERRLQLVRQ